MNRISKRIHELEKRFVSNGPHGPSMAQIIRARRLRLSGHGQHAMEAPPLPSSLSSRVYTIGEVIRRRRLEIRAQAMAGTHP